MARVVFALIAAVTALSIGATSTTQPGEAARATAADPFAWLEERHGTRALAWVQQQNSLTERLLGADPRFGAYRDLALSVGSSRSSDVDYRVADGWVHRIVQDASHPRGVWQRIQYAAYVDASDAPWETVLDLDSLATAEGKNWYFWNGTLGLRCSPEGETSCLISLSDQGVDDTRTIREFDLRARAFAADGFNIPERELWMEWLDGDSLLISEAAGRGSPSTGQESKRDRVLVWRRGESLARATEIWRGSVQDSGGGALLHRLVDERGKARIIIRQQHTGIARTHWLLDERARPIKMSLPGDVSAYAIHRGQLVFTVDEDWQKNGRTYRAGALLSADLAQVTQEKFPVAVLSERRPRDSDYYPIVATSAAIVTAVYDNMRPRILGFSFDGRRWSRRELLAGETVALRPEMADPRSPIVLVEREGFVTPIERLRIDVRGGAVSLFEKPQHAPDASLYVVERAEAPSADGALIPYSIARRRDVAYDGAAPTFIYAYGGSLGSRWPTFSPERENLWLRQGGIYVVANIRGGGEFGPAWHRAAIKTRKQRSVDDVIAVAEELIRRKVTSARHLGIKGESNGGMVMGAALVQRPELFGAVILEVPDLDLVQFTRLNGSTDTAEIGSPDVPLEREALRKLSPYENLKKVPQFPVPLLISSTVDEVVHPAHARKFTAKMQSFGMPVIYYENATGGHHHNFSPREWAEFQAYEYVYLSRRLMDAPADTAEPAAP